MRELRSRFWIRLISLIIVETFCVTTMRTDLAWGARESSSLSLVGRRNSDAAFPGQTLLRPRASGKSALDGAFKRLFGGTAKDGASRSFVDIVTETGIFTPDRDPTVDPAVYGEMVGSPGSFPYIRGNFAKGYRERPFLYRKYSGGKAPSATNRLFRRQVKQVGPNLSVAYDLPSQQGRDSNDPLARNETGLAGVSIQGLWDYRTLWNGIDLAKISTSHTINQTAFMMFMMYLSVAREQGVTDSKQLNATFQNDVLKEYLSRKTHRLPLGITLRLWSEMQEFIAKNGYTGVRGTSISSYHIREAGATAIQEVAFMFANALEYLSAARARGLSVNEIAPTISFFVNLKQDLIEEVAKLRVFRSVWAKLIQELQRQEVEETLEKELATGTLKPEGVQARREALLAAQPTKPQFFPVMAYTGGTDTTVEKAQNNIARVALKVLAGPLGGAQAVNTIAWDEPFTINTEHPEQIAIDTMHMLKDEKGLLTVSDLLGGSYAVEAKTRELEEAVWKELAKIAGFPTYQEALEYMGGRDPHSGEIARSSREEMARIASGEKKKVGVNVSTEGSNLFPRPEEPSTDIRAVLETQRRRLREARAVRSEARVKRALTALEKAARDPDAKLLPLVQEALNAYATVGEVMAVFTKVFGESDTATPWMPSEPVETFHSGLRTFLAGQGKAFRAGVAREEAQSRGYFVALDLPWRKRGSQIEIPGQYPFTRGIDREVPQYSRYDPSGLGNDFLTRALLDPEVSDVTRSQSEAEAHFRRYRLGQVALARQDALVVVDGYAMREKGLSATDEVLFTIRHLEQFMDAGIAAGLDKAEIAHRLSVLLSSGDNFGEEIAKFRAARRVWAKRLKERYGLEDEEALKLRIHAKTSQSTYTTSRSWNNSVRAAWQALQAYLGQVQTIQVTPFDAPFGQDTNVSVLANQMAHDTFDIVQYETGVSDSTDPLGGSFAIEAWTDHIEQKVTERLERWDQKDPQKVFVEMRGILGVSETGRIEAMRTKEVIRVGVDKYIEGVDRPPHPIAEESLFTRGTSSPTIKGLFSENQAARSASAGSWYAQAADLAKGARQALGQFTRSPYTVGIAVTPEHFDAIRSAWGNPPLSDVPSDVGVEEFEIVEEGVHLDILRQKNAHPDKTIGEHVAKRGEGIQQIELLTVDVDKALGEIRERAVASPTKKEKIKVVLAKPGLDGHDRGLKYIATLLQQSGMEVVYLGLFNTPEQIVNAAIQEDADVVAISLHSGAHMTYFPEIAKLLTKKGAGNILVTGGGIIPTADRDTLQNEFGIGPLFGPDAKPGEIIDAIRTWQEWSRRADRIKIVRPEEGPRVGANNTLVKFFLVRLPDGRPVLTELVQEPHERSASASDGAVKSGDFLLYGRAVLPAETIQFPEQLLENSDSEPAQIGGAFEEFVREQVMPHSEKLDRHEVNVEEGIMGKAAELGMLGITVPEAYGGLDVKKITKILADMWAWYGDASFASLVRVHGGVGTMPIVMFGTEEQKQKYLPKLASGEYIGAYLLTEEAHGSDSLNRETELQTKAVLKRDPDGTEYWEISGNKRFVTNARFSNLFTVFAMTQNETGEWVKSVFIIERDTPGVVVEGDYHKMGLKGSSTADVKFDTVRVPKENLLGEIGQGSKIGMSILNHGRTAVGAGSLGGSRRLFEETLKFVTARKQFGRPLSDFGAVRETLADMAVSIYAQESVLFAVGGLFDGGEPNPGIEAAITKVFGSEALNRIAYQATQKHGGNGIMEEYAATRFYRDARVMTIFEGANEILLSQVIAPGVLKYLKTEIRPKGLSIFSDWKVLWGSSETKEPFVEEMNIIHEAATLVERTAKGLDERFASPEAKKAPESQSYTMAFGEMVTELFAMASTVSRTLRRLEKGYDSTQEINLTRVFVTEAMERIQKKASRILEGSPHTALPTAALIGLKHQIAARVIETTAKDAGSKSVEELRADIVAAFGGDIAQADEDIRERLTAMQKVNPQATREEAIARLAWEYQSRPTEHVFPGDNFSFMFRAAQSDAHILLLDLEDAVATPRKEMARNVITLLIRAFRGERLAPEQLDFLWNKAIINPKDKEAGIEKYFDSVDGNFQLKKEFWFKEDQMILVRPNNLRTKWSAGDYSIVIRGIGHLIDGIYMPKVEGFDRDVEITVSILRAIQNEQNWAEGRHKIFVLTELPGAVIRAKEILSTAPEVEEAQLGVVDYTAATGGKNAVQLDHFTYMRYPMLHLVEAARETGKVAGTGITVRLTVEDTSEDTEKVTRLGIHRKWSVHPNHLTGMKPHLDKFPPVVRKRLKYEEIKPYDLKRLDGLASQSKPILPPKVLVPQETELVRSVVRVEALNFEHLQIALASEADMVIIDLDSLFRGKFNDAEVYRFIQFLKKSQTNKRVAFQIDPKQDRANLTLGLIHELIHQGMARTFILSNARTGGDVREMDGLLTEIEREEGLPVGTIRLGARLAEPKAVENEAYFIASASRRLQWLFFGLSSLPKEAPDDPTSKGYNYYRSAFIAATSLADVDAIDERSDAPNLESETTLAANWGFHGKVGQVRQITKINQLMNPQRSGVAPTKPGKEVGEAERSAWAAFVERWKNSVERDLAILEVYADADQDRQLGAVGYTDPHTGQPEIVDAASARIPYRQMERALKAGILSADEQERYFRARERLLLALRPGGTEGGTRILPGQKILGNAVTMREWMVRAFAGTSLDRNRYHLDRAYAEQSKFKGLVAHGLLTMSTVLAGFEQILPDYRLASIQKFSFMAPVRYDDTIVPLFEGLEGDGEKMTVRLSAVNQKGETVFEMFVAVRPRAPNEPYRPKTPNSYDLGWLKGWVRGVQPSFPSQIFDFTNPESPREQSFEKEINPDLVRATHTLFGTVSSELLTQLLAVGTMAMASAESVPGHLLLGGKEIEFGVPVQEGDLLTATATVPAHDQIRRSKKDNAPVVPVTIVVTNQKNEVVFKGQVSKIMEMIAAKDGSDKIAPVQPERIPSTLPEMLNLAVLSAPYRTVTFSKKKVTYQVLENQSNRFADTLLTRGLRKGDRVAVMLPNSAEYLIAMFGTWKMGGIFTTLKTQYKSEEIQRELNETEAKVLVIFEEYLPYLKAITSNLHHSPEVLVVHRADLELTSREPMRSLLRDASSFPPHVQISPEDDAAIAYTTGSTGEPKGVVLSHGAILAAVNQTAAWLREAGEGPVASLVPLTPTYGGNVILAAFKEGRPVVIFPRGIESGSEFYRDVVDVLEQEEAMVLFGVPSSFLQLAETLKGQQKILPHLRIALSRGSKLTAEIQQALERANPGTKVMEGGGLTEASTYVTNRPDRNKIGTVGPANPGVTVKIVNPETLEELPGGEVGEILVRAPQGMKGYWKDPVESAKVLLADGWIRSGDLGTMDEEGYLTYKGRLKEVIITGGLNVGPIEVEEVLQQHPDIREVAVAGIADSNWFTVSDEKGRELVRRFGEVVVAFVVLKEGSAVTSDPIIEWAKSRMADYKVPKRIVVVDAIPRIGAYDKVDRQALIRSAAAQDGASRHGVLVEKDPRGFTVLTIDRPGAFPTNALSIETFRAIEAALDSSTPDEVMILTGGGGHFIGGGDLQYVSDHADSEGTLRNYFETAERVALKIARKRVIAAIPGEAVGGGVQLAFATRYRIGQRGAYMRMPEVQRLNIIAGFGGTQIIPRVFGIRKALELMLTGKKATDGVFDEMAEDPLARAKEIAALYAQKRVDQRARNRIDTIISDSVSETQLDEWDSVFNKNGTLRRSERNATLLALLAQRESEGHGNAAHRAVRSVALGFKGSLEEGLAIERSLAIEQTQTPEARASLTARLEEAKRSPWAREFPGDVPGGIQAPQVPVHEWVAAALEAHGDQKIHLLSGRKGDPRGRMIRYRDLQEPADQFAHALYDMGVRKGDRVAVMVPDSFQYIIALLAASKIGAILVGIDIFSAPPELSQRLNMTTPKVMLILDEFHPRLTEIQRDVPSLETVILTGRNDFVKGFPSELPEEGEGVRYFGRLLETYSPEVPAVGVGPDDTAILSFTGGLTGSPKAAELTHRNLVSTALQRAYWLFQGIDLSQSVVMADLPYYHSYGLNGGLLMALSQGAELVILPHYPKEHTDAMAEAVSEHGVHYLIGLPTTFDRVVGRLAQNPVPIHLKGGLSSGALLQEETRRAFEAVTGAWLRQGFGLTEASSVIHEPIGSDPVGGSIGIPMPDVEVMVVRSDLKDQLVPVHDGEMGELVVRGPQVFKGYWGNPDETRGVKTEEGWVRTGDLVHRDKAGRIYLVAREKHMIKVGGNQVFPSEVEAILMQHEKISEVAIFGIPDETTGEAVVAYIRPVSGRSLAEKEIEDYAKSKLSTFKVPTIIRVTSDKLPKKKGTKEVDYEELKRRAFRRHLVDSVQQGKWSWVLRQIQESPLVAGNKQEICTFCLEELKNAYDVMDLEASTLERRRLSIRLFLWSLVQHEDLIGSSLKERAERQLAYWQFRDNAALFFREPIAELAAELRRLQKEKRGDDLFEAAWEAIRNRYQGLTPPDVFRVSREEKRPKADGIAGSFLFRDVVELNDPDNPFNPTKNQRYIPTLEEVQGVSYEWGFSPLEAVAYLRARHDAYYDDKSVFSAIANFVDPEHPDRAIPVMIVGLQKGSNTAEKILRNQGYTMPWGYWKYVRAIRLAERFRLPVVSLVDVTGAWNGLSGAVEDISGAVSYAIQVGAEKTVPGTVIVTGEGGSAGGLAATMDKTFMLSNATRFVATPRGQFEILNLHKKVASLVLGALQSKWTEFSIEKDKQPAFFQTVQAKIEESAKVGNFNLNSFVKILMEAVLETGGKLPEGEALEAFKTEVSVAWKKYDDAFIDRIVFATQAVPTSGLAFDSIGGIIEEPIGGAHRFPEGTYLAIGRNISGFLDHVEDLSTPEVQQERYDHFRRMGSVQSGEYLVKEHPLERKKAVLRDLERGKLGIQDWLEKLVDRGEAEELLIEEINPNLADRDEGPIDFYRKLDLPDVFPFDAYQKALEKAREATGSWSGIFTGYATIDGRRVMLIVKDPRFMGASDKSGLIGEKITLAIEDAIRRYDEEGVTIPIVLINTASGARQQDGPRSIDPLNKNEAALSLAKERGIPFINIDTVYSYGGDSASTATYQDAAMLLATKGTQKGFTGPRPTASVEGRNLPDLYFSVDFLMRRGFLDGIVEIEQVRDVLALYLNPETEILSAQKLKPLLEEIQARRQRRVRNVRQREKVAFPALHSREEWIQARLHFLGRLNAYYDASSEKRPWMAEHVDTASRFYVPSLKRRYIPERTVIPKGHPVHSPQFLTEAQAVLESLKSNSASARDGASRLWSPPLRSLIETMGEAERVQVVEALGRIRKMNVGATFLTADTPLSVETFARQDTIYVVDGALLKGELTRKEFEMILSLLQKAGRTAPVWIVETEPGATYGIALASFDERYSFVELKSLDRYYTEEDNLEMEKVPFVRIGFGFPGYKNQLGLLDVQIRKPQPGEAISALSFMALALSKDPTLRGIVQEAEALLESIEADLMITPNSEYWDAVETLRKL